MSNLPLNLIINFLPCAGKKYFPKGLGLPVSFVDESERNENELLN